MPGSTEPHTPRNVGLVGQKFFMLAGLRVTLPLGETLSVKAQVLSTWGHYFSHTGHFFPSIFFCSTPTWLLDTTQK